MTLARIFHWVSTNTAQSGMSIALRLFGRLDILSNSLALPSLCAPYTPDRRNTASCYGSREYAIHARLLALDTKPYGISWLTKIKQILLYYFALFLLVTLISSCATQRWSTTYAHIPKPVKKNIEKNYEDYNAFFYQAFDKPNTFLFWYYKQATVHWFSYINGKLSNKGTFESDNGAHNMSINETNNLLKDELGKFQETCQFALDGETFGYVIQTSERRDFSPEFIDLTYISTKKCFDNAAIDNFIANDFKKIRDLNYKFTVDLRKPQN